MALQCLLILPLAAQISVTGRVVSDSNEPLAGASVIGQGTDNGTTTDASGKFRLTVPENSELVVSHVDYDSRNVPVVSGRTDYEIKLIKQEQQLDEVVVVGYGVQKKKLVTGATVQVKGDDIRKQNTISPFTALQGSTPGVYITQSSGMPGEGFKVNIRGLGTNGNAEPLYVINGIVGGNINDLNPSDIESIDVLKDAASAAIYGARAANGVILVTTRQGAAGKTVITFDSYVGVQNVYKMPSMLNAGEYAVLQNEGALNDGKPEYNFAGLVPGWADIQSGRSQGTNWLEDSRVKNALIQNHALNVTGGNDMSVYSLGLSYSDQEGVLGKPVAPDYQRYTFRLNSEHTLIKKGDLSIVKMGENLIYSNKQTSGIGIGNVYWNDVRNMMLASPFLPNRDEDGGYHYAIPWNLNEGNPIAAMNYERGQNINKSKDLRGNIFIEIQPIRGLKFRSNFGYNDYSSSYRRFVPTYDLSLNMQKTENEVSQSMITGVGYSFDNTLSYIFNIKNHNFDVMIGQSVEKTGLGEEIGGTHTNSGFNDFKHAYLDNTIRVKGTMFGHPLGESIIASAFGRINYDYKQTYMFTATFRVDGSSKFARGNRWGYFPSFSGGWNLTNESFMEATRDWLNFFKLRASWGQNGNTQIDGFQYLALISSQNSLYFFGPDKSNPTSGSFPEILPNKNITWETSEQINIGFDSRFLRSRLGVVFDYYNKKTKDWLLIAPHLDSFGAGAPFTNGGDVENKGFEIALNWSDRIRDFDYQIGVSMANNSNKVTRVANLEGIIEGKSNILSNSTMPIYRLEVGQPMGAFYGFRTKGVFQNEQQIADYTGAKYNNTRPGDLIFDDRDGDGEITMKDRTVLGNPNPNVVLGLNISLGYKGFDLNFVANGMFGHQNVRSYGALDNPKTNNSTWLLGRWHGEGTSNRLPRLTSGTHQNWTNFSDIYVEDADFVRIQNLTLGYDLKKLFTKMPMSQLRIYFAAQNLATFTKYKGLDPEVGHSGDISEPWSSGVDIGFYPRPRTFLFGVNLKF